LVQYGRLHTHDIARGLVVVYRRLVTVLPIVPGAPSAYILTPIFLVSGIRPLSALLICFSILSSSLIFRVMLGKRSLYVDDEMFAYVTLVSGIGFLSGLGLIAVGQMLALSVGVAALIVAACVCASKHFRARLQQIESSTISAGDLSIGLSAALFFLGWQSLGFLFAALLLSRCIRSLSAVKFALTTSKAVVALGYLLSFWAEKSMASQYWLSADQLFRTTIAAGLSTWGYTDFAGAVGTTLNYQWLGESTAGVIARFSLASAAEGTAVITPAIGLHVSALALRKIATQLEFEPKVAVIGTFITILLCKEFEVFSIGSLWGLSLFLIAVSIINQIILGTKQVEWPARGPSVSLVLLTPFVTLAQSTLGLLLLVMTGLIGAYYLIRRRKIALYFIAICTTQLSVILILRTTLLVDGLTVVYTPTFSPNNILQFRGLNLYNGDNRVFVVVVSVLFLMLLTQTGAGFLLLDKRRLTNPVFRIGMTASVIAGLLLANGVAIGGSESQQSRFLSPLVVLVTLVSSLLIVEELTRLRAHRSPGSTGWLSFAMLIATLLLVTVLGVAIYSMEWSMERSFGIALMVVLGQLIFVTLWFTRHKSSSRGHVRPFTLAVSLLALMFMSHARNISNLVDLQASAKAPSREVEFLGSRGTRDCLAEIRENTSRETIIATNWFRTPPPSRRPKYFLVSAWTERRVFLDGPEYVRNTTGGITGDNSRGLLWLDERYQATDNFAERASGEAYEVLRAADVEYFVFETYMPAPPTWEPYAEVIFERDSCKILKLRT